MSNPRNTGARVGRLANDPKVFENRDGSKKVLFTLMVDRNYSNAQNERQSDAIDFEAFINKATNGLGPYANVHKGDLIGVQDTLRKDVYQKNGQTVYELKVIAEEITFLESRSVTQARLAERVDKAEAQNQALHGQEPAAARTPAEPVAAAAPAEPVYAGMTNSDEPPF